MLQALEIADALAIAEAARRRSRDERAMVDYLGIGRKRPRGPPPDRALLIPDAVDIAAFESDERRRLEEALTRLSPDARRELIALVWLAQRPALDFAAALRRTRRIPATAQTGYLMGMRLERDIALGLEKLGTRPP